ncbi:aKG-HExxH-type peptide beta-hydroxylase [Catellatospora citrea]|uniref:HEXXH motif domain-containing protein n=1 Tax=Catellatospora citrea TaxID=53366 RepID=A0A8J3KK40_9ACTN|nr:HEXXH motif-containing putative peptide modification protein [Catellatospora citrea]RKE11144.1 HEXXH motif-containing protein [Catellatospora citrea]GIF96609.1 HEXXH motif domain-containing protein [Catellatospora citrea]
MLTTDELADIGGGVGRPATLRRLVQGQLGKRRVLAAALMRRATGTAGEVFQAAVDRDSAAVDRVLSDPFTDAWVTGHLLGRPDGDRNADAIATALATAAAVTAGVEADLIAEGLDDTFFLPGLGAANGLGRGHLRIGVRGRGRLCLAGPAQTLEIDVRDARRANWAPSRWLTFTEQGRSWTVLLEDLHPYRGAYPWQPLPRLDQAAFSRCAALLGGAWRWIVRHSPAHADGISSVVSSVVPVVRPPDGRDVSGSSRTAGGAVGVSMPTAAAGMALLLMHEAQHVKLGAAADVVRLYEPAGAARHRAPWRADPRPVGGLLQGAYAHLGVGEFWRLRRDDGDADAALANFEFAYSRDMVSHAVTALQASRELTAAGEEIAAGMARAAGDWKLEQIPDGVSTAVDDVEGAETVRWYLSNHSPFAADVNRLASRWRSGASPEPRGVAVSVVARTAAPAGTSGLAALTRARLAGHSYGANAADQAFAEGCFAVALDGYRRRIAADIDDDDAWVGLALARCRLGLSRSTDALVTRPSLVKETCRVAGPPATPEAIAVWLDSGSQASGGSM